MKLFAIPLPIFDINMSIDAYHISYKNSDNLIISDQVSSMIDGTVNPRLLEFLDNVGLETLTLDAPIFLPFTNISLLGDFPNYLKTSPHKVIITLDKSVTSDAIYLDKIKHCKTIGFKFAFRLSSTKPFEPYRPVLSLMDYIVVDQIKANKKTAMEVLKEYPNAISIASNVNTYSMFNLAKASGYNLFEGKFYRIPLSVSAKPDLSPLKVLCIQLLNTVREDNFDLDEVSRIVEKDISLSVSMLRHINAQGFTSKISTIQHAAAMLGQNELRKWVSSSASAQLGSDKPSEINRLSLIRAKFAEQLAPLFGLEKHADSLFLMGLFSVLDVLLDTSIDEALKMVSVSDEIRYSLVDFRGPYFPLFEFMQYYEAADWTNVSRFLILNEVPAERLHESYTQTLAWYKDLISSIEKEA